MKNNNTNGITTTFINIRTDFGFKHMFGSIRRKHLVIRLLNALFNGKITITDVEYHDKEVLPEDETGKSIIYDIYCTSNIKDYSESFFKKDSMLVHEVDEDGNPIESRTHHFILEMQNAYEPPFEDRVLYYITKALASQGKRGWNYILEPVLMITVTNFDFPHMSKKIDRRIGVTDLESGELFTDKLQIISLSLAQIKGKEWNDCNTELERILFLMKNMDKLDKNSEAYTCKEYDDFFDAAESKNIVCEQAVAYSQSLERLMSAERGLRYAERVAIEKGLAEGLAKGLAEGTAKGLAEGTAKGLAEGTAKGLAEGRAKGLAEGRAEGRAEGQLEGLKLAAANMKKNGLPIEQIMAFTNLSEETVMSL